jgi:hypothetical protein
MSILTRCSRCCQPLIRYEGELLCPNCTTYVLVEDDTHQYVPVKLPRPFAYEHLIIDALDYAIGTRTDAATVIHVRGRADGDVPFAGALVIAEGRDVPTHDLRTFGSPLDTDALAGAVEAALARLGVPQEEMRRISAQG